MDKLQKKSPLDELSYPKLLVFLSLLIIVMISTFLFSEKEQHASVVASVVTPPLDTPSIQEKFDATLPAIALAENIFESQAILVYDINEKKVLFSENESRPLPLASLTKLMTAYVASSLLKESDLILLSEEDLQTEGDSGLFANETWRFEALRDFMLLASSNDASTAIAMEAGTLLHSATPLEAFVSEMNKTAQRLNLRSMRFTNPSGLDYSTSSASNYGNAQDIVSFLVHLLATRASVLEATAQTEMTFLSEDGLLHNIANTNERAFTLPGLIGSKTGFTDLAGGNLAVIFDVGIGRPVVVVVLGSTREGRFNDVEKIVTLLLS